MTSQHRFPDLTGKAVIVAGTSDLLVEITRHLASNGMLIAVVAPDRELVRQSVEVAERLGAMVNGFTVDPADPGVWERIRPHIEQRLGPIDVAILAGAPNVHSIATAALVPDMAARHRGVVIEIGASGSVESLADGVRHHFVDAALAEDTLVALVTRYASDTTA